MRFGNNYDNRYRFIVIVLTILMGILMIRLAILTLVHGDDYREDADNKRVRDIPITAARGEIRDKNGKLLAGSKPSFAVQILKDEFESKDKQERNEELLKLTRLLEEDGVSYVDDFPIELNVFKFKGEDIDVIQEMKPLDYVLDVIKENQLVGALLKTDYNHVEPDVGYDFSIPAKIIQHLRNRGLEIPVEVIRTEAGYDFEFSKNIDIEKWKKDNNLSPSATAYSSLVDLTMEDNVVLREVLGHSLVRKIVYTELESCNLANNIDIEEYVLKHDEDYKMKKKELMNSYGYVTMETTAEEDFINIFKEVSLDNFLNEVIVTEDSDGKEKRYVPGEKLLRMVKDEENIKVKLVKKDDEVSYEYTTKDKIEKTPYELLIDTANKTGIMEKFLTDDEIRGRAQSRLLKDGVNTRISIADGYEYIYLNEKRILYDRNDILDEDGRVDMDVTVKEAFNRMKAKHEIKDDISKYETMSILSFYNLLTSQGYMGYHPINIAYGIQDTTVAKIEEGMAEVSAIQVSIEPVRYYPNGESTAHIIGQLGRISQQNEIDEYIKEKKYSPNDIIGKTGIEQSFEDTLKGKNGVRKVEVDAYGNTINILEETKPIPGDNIYLSIDLDIQQKAEEVLRKTLNSIQVGGTYTSEWGNYKMATNRKRGRPYKNAKSGATVAVNVKTGEVIAIASDPSYDPNLFSTGISTADWEDLLPKNEEDLLAPRPLYNIGIQTAVQPGSTFKPITGLAGLDNGLSPHKKIRDMGYVEIGGEPYRCHIWKNGGGSHGYEDIYDAMRDSCNYYFYSLMLGRNQRTGESLGMKVEIDDIINLTTQLGMNDKTGIEINIPNETHGGAPNPERKASGIKNMLRYDLNSRIKDYIIEGKNFSDEELEAIIEEIVSWVYQEGALSKPEVVKRLNDLGIDGDRRLPGEKDSIADRIKYTFLNQASWNIGDSLNISIGQGEAEYTPIQMANAIATISNGGYHNKLTLIDNIKNYNNSEMKFNREVESKRIELNDYENLEHIKKAMLKVSKSGTSRRAFGNFPIDVGTKTGTAEKSGRNPATGEYYDDFAWFIGFGPYDDPEIAVATVIFQGGTGGNAAPMTRDIIGEYLGLGLEEQVDDSPFNNTLAQ